MQYTTQDIWDKFNHELQAFILTKVQDKAVANEILQEVFLKIIDHADKVNKAGNLQQYIYAIARNATYDYFRNKKSTLDLERTNIPFTEEDINTLNTTIAECCIRPFILKLPGKYRDALIKTEFEGLSQKKLASELGLSYSGAKSRVQRGREKLRDMILNCCEIQSDRYGNLQGSEIDNCDC